MYLVELKISYESDFILRNKLCWVESIVSVYMHHVHSMNVSWLLTTEPHMYIMTPASAYARSVIYIYTYVAQSKV
jgi:hypothetical protein